MAASVADSEFIVDDFEHMVEEGEFMDAHDKRDLDALLSFRKSITSDPHGLLYNWTVENSQNIC
jgi:hypothetical protein